MKTWTLKELKDFITKEFENHETCKGYQSNEKIFKDNLAKAMRYAAEYFPEHIDELQGLIDELKEKQ